MKKNYLPTNIVNLIIQFIAEKREHIDLKTKFPNALLRADVLDLLDMYCTVIYYPLENESNNGFHITGIVDKKGNEKHFVYINTNQTIEKQIFTAAHELGHVWEVDSFVLNNLDCNIGEFDNEDIINRFAAELLMPYEQFLAVFENEYQNHKSEDGKVSLSGVLNIIATIMNQFLVPQKAVVCRLFELGIINKKTLELLLGEAFISEEDITKYIISIMRENGHDRFFKPTHKKHIDGLARLLEIAEKNETLSPRKIEKIRQTFDLPRKQCTEDSLDGIIDVTTSGGEK